MNLPSIRNVFLFISSTKAYVYTQFTYISKYIHIFGKQYFQLEYGAEKELFLLAESGKTFA